MAVEVGSEELTARRSRRRFRRPDLTAPGLLGLPVAWLAVFFIVPIATLLSTSTQQAYLAAHELETVKAILAQAMKSRPPVRR